MCEDDLCMCTCVCMCVYACVHVCAGTRAVCVVHTCTCVCVCTYMCVCMRACARVFVCEKIHLLVTFFNLSQCKFSMYEYVCKDSEEYITCGRIGTHFVSHLLHLICLISK